MTPASNRHEPAPRGPQRPERGAPATYAAHATRKDLTVRVSLTAPAPPEPDELREHGYGHGV